MTDNSKNNAEPLTLQEQQRFEQLVAREMIEYTGPSLVALYGCRDEDHGRLVGSGTFFEHQDRFYILTARHVTNELEQFDIQCCSRSGLHGEGGDEPQILTSEPIVSMNYDLAAIPIERSALDSTVRFINTTQFMAASPRASLEEELRGDILFLHGYPGQTSQFFATWGELHSRTLPFTTFVNEDETTDELLAVDFMHNNVRTLEDGGSYRDVDPRGLSGCTLWKSNLSSYGDEWCVSNARVAGVIFEWRGKTMVLDSVPAPKVLEFIESELSSS